MLIGISCSDVFFFFKQKTAYEMRISDWSSDVCSSDLTAEGIVRRRALAVLQPHLQAGDIAGAKRSLEVFGKSRRLAHRRGDQVKPLGGSLGHPWSLIRSEEHTSELKSLMRISYAVICLKKKKHDN